MFFDNLTKICEEQNIKLTPLLIKLNLSAGNINKWRNGTLPNGEILIKLANSLNCSIDYLLDYTDNIQENENLETLELKNSNNIIEKILLLMETYKLTAKQLTDTLQLPNSAITEWKKGKSKPSTEAIIKIADYFNVSTDYLLGRIENNQANGTTKIEENQIELIENFKKLNEKGKEEALKRVHELTYISQYTNAVAQEKIRPSAIAAHGGKGVEMKPITKEQLEKTQENLKKIKFRTE